MTLAALMELVGAYRPRAQRSSAPAASAQVQTPVTSFGDALDRALLRLACGGYSADIRTFSLALDDHRKTLAVYIGRGDPRINWTSPNAAGVPLDFEYRSDDRCDADFTLFSGDSALEIEQFVSRLTSPCQPAESCGPVRMPRPEWDPHRMSATEQSNFDQLMLEFDDLMRASEIRARVAAVYATPQVARTRDRRRP